MGKPKQSGQTMGSANHLNDEELFAYLEDPAGSRFRGQRLHLATCGECRGQLQRLQQVADWVGEHAAEVSLGGQSVDESVAPQALAALAGGTLEGAERDALLQRIHADPGARRAALHAVAQHRAQMPKAPPAASADDSRMSRFLQWRLPVWMSVPATALVSVLLVLLVIGGGSPTVPLSLVAYRDDPNIHFTVPGQTTPGIGFFQAARTSSSSYRAPSVTLVEANRLQFAWSAVEGAVAYRLRVAHTGRDSSFELPTVVTERSQANVTASQALPAGRYEWELSGTLADGRSFRTRGGFVLQNQAG